MPDNVSPAAALVQRLEQYADEMDSGYARGLVAPSLLRDAAAALRGGGSSPDGGTNENAVLATVAMGAHHRVDSAPESNLLQGVREGVASIGGGSSPTGETRDDSTGLSIDMLDVDRLRSWADLIDIHGADITHWGQVAFVVAKLREIADGVEQAVRDIGALRKAAVVAPSWQVTHHEDCRRFGKDGWSCHPACLVHKANETAAKDRARCEPADPEAPSSQATPPEKN
jgi:hypothetical protein